MGNLLIKMLMVEIYFVINGIPTILCFLSDISNICVKGFCKSLFCFVVGVGTKYYRIFP